MRTTQSEQPVFLVAFNDAKRLDCGGFSAALPRTQAMRTGFLGVNVFKSGDQSPQSKRFARLDASGNFQPLTDAAGVN